MMTSRGRNRTCWARTAHDTHMEGNEARIQSTETTKNKRRAWTEREQGGKKLDKRNEKVLVCSGAEHTCICLVVGRPSHFACRRVVACRRSCGHPLASKIKGCFAPKTKQAGGGQKKLQVVDIGKFFCRALLEKAVKTYLQWALECCRRVCFAFKGAIWPLLFSIVGLI